MSVIVAIKSVDAIYMGCDTQTTSGKDKENKLQESTFKISKLWSGMPDKSNTNPAKTPIFTPFLPNSRLKYVQYVGVRLCQKSSKIAAFWLFASLAPMFFGKTRRVSALILDV